jgi:hypothetical protein
VPYERKNCKDWSAEEEDGARTEKRSKIDEDSEHIVSLQIKPESF